MLEASGNYPLRLVDAILKAGSRVLVVKLLSIKRFGQMLTCIDETDARDAVY